jgi:hypothetical protein
MSAGGPHCPFSTDEQDAQARCGGSTPGTGGSPTGTRPARSIRPDPGSASAATAAAAARHSRSACGQPRCRRTGGVRAGAAREGSRRTTAWRLITDEDQIAQRAPSSTGSPPAGARPEPVHAAAPEHPSKPSSAASQRCCSPNPGRTRRGAEPRRCISNSDSVGQASAGPGQAPTVRPAGARRSLTPIGAYRHGRQLRSASADGRVIVAGQSRGWAVPLLRRPSIGRMSEERRLKTHTPASRRFADRVQLVMDLTSRLNALPSSDIDARVALLNEILGKPLPDTVTIYPTLQRLRTRDRVWRASLRQSGLLLPELRRYQDWRPNDDCPESHACWAPSRACRAVRIRYSRADRHRVGWLDRGGGNNHPWREDWSRIGRWGGCCCC